MGNTKQQLNIAMLGHKRIPSREGGIEIVVEELCTRMVRLGHRVTCYNRRGRHIAGRAFDAAPMKEYRGVRLRSVCTIDVKGLAAMTSSFFASIRAALGPYDVVHYHAEGPCAMLWLPKLFGKRCVATIHGLDHERAKWGRFAKRYLLLGAKCAAKYADALIVLNPGDQRYFRETFHRDAILIPNGVNRPELLKPDLIRKQFGLRGNDYILFLGRLVPEKGLHTLIEGFRKVRTDKKLVIAGGGSDTDGFVAELKALAAEDERILFTGFVQGALLAELYSNAYIYTLPSDLEGMPLSLLEAMSYGNCCLVSDIPECADVVEDCGLTFRKSDIGDLTDKLQSLCDHPEEVQAFKSRAADFICSRYSWDEVVERTLACYGKK